MDGPFVITKKKYRNKIIPTNFESNLEECKKTVRDSLMFQDLKNHINSITIQIKAIRCLAIGSFTEDFPARYQLALLLEIIEYLQEGQGSESLYVSIYDPVFNKEDKTFINQQSIGTWSIDETFPSEGLDINTTFFFLPHAPLDLTESVLINERPKYYLANNIIQHTDHYTKSQLYEKYPVISKLVNTLQNTQTDMKSKEVLSTENLENDSFTTFVSKRNRKSKKNRKYIFKETPIDFTKVDVYFNKVEILSDFNNGEYLKNKPWINSFSDMTFHLII